MDLKKVSVLMLALVLASTTTVGIGAPTVKAPATVELLGAAAEPFPVSGSRASSEITLITGDIVTVTYLPDGQRGISIIPADPKSCPNFLRYETSVGTYVIPGNADLEKLDMQLFNLDYLIEEGYCDMKDLPVIISVSGASQQSVRAFGKQMENLKSMKTVSPNGLSVLSAKIPLSAAKDGIQALIEDSHVKKVWLDRKVHVSLNDSVPLIGAPDVWNFGYNGSGIEIAIVDTGIDKTHPDLDDLDDDPNTTDPKVVREVNFSDDPNTYDYRGHGTHCAGIAAGTGAASGGKNKGVAPGAKLWNVKVLNGEGWGYESWVISGIEYAYLGPDGLPKTGDEADIISLSLGGDITDGTDPVSLAADAAVDAGVVVAISAGNDGIPFGVHSPGCARKPITVGASDRYDKLAVFSSQGPTIDFRMKPDILAPGVYVNSTIPLWSGTYYGRKSGTSMAAPHVAGAAALVLQTCQKKPSGWTSPQYVKNALISTARDLGYTVYEQGGGRIDVPSAVSTDLAVDPATVSFGFYAESNDSDSTVITFHNLNATSDRSLTLNVTVCDVASRKLVSCATLNTTSLNIGPNSNASVLLTIDTTVPKSLYSGRVVATTDEGKTVHTIFGFAKLCKITINKTKWQGLPGRHDQIGIIGDPGFPKVTLSETDSNGNASLYVTTGTYHVFSVGYQLVNDAYIFTMKENVTITEDTVIQLDERTTKAVDFDPNKPGQKIASRNSWLAKPSVFSMMGWWVYPKTALTYVSQTTMFKTVLSYEYYPIEYYHEANWLHIESPEWHNVVYALEQITGNTTIVANYSSLVRRTTDYKTAMGSADIQRFEFACHPYLGGSNAAEAWFMEAPKRMVHWLSPEPASYIGFYGDEAERWGFLYFWGSEWYTHYKSYQAGTNPYYAFGEHPFTSGARIRLGATRLRVEGAISTDTFGNTFWATRPDAGNLTILNDGTEVYRKGIWDEFNESIPYSGTPRLTAIIEGKNPLSLSTKTLTTLTFTANPLADYEPPQITMRAQMSNLDSTVPQGNILVNVTVQDKNPVISATMEYSTDDGATWNEATEISVLDDAHQFSLAIMGKHTYVSLRANATDSGGNTISQTTIRGFYVAPYGDIAITDAALSKTAILRGRSMSINVSIGNQWLFAETFNLTMYCNETAITLPSGENYTTITLENGSQTTITLPWNTTDFSKGKYTITTHAWPVSGETDTEDNTYVAGTVYIVAILGDISGPLEVPDGKVDIQDLARVSKAFGTYPGSPRWNPNTDVNDDDKVDIKDVAMVSGNFGKIDP